MKTAFLLSALLISGTLLSTETVYVKSTYELIKALRNNRHIIIENGTYDITYNDTLKNLSRHFVQTSDIWENIEITGLQNVTFEGKGNVSIIITDPYSWVINFTDCKNLTFKNIEIGHKVEGECMGGAALFQNSQKIKMFKVGLYGCGTTGIELRNVNEFVMDSSKVYKCTYYLTKFSNSDKVIISNTTFENSGIFEMFSFSDNKKVRFDNCLIQKNTQKENHYQPIYFIDVISAIQSIEFNKCIFLDNKYNQFSNSLNSLRLDKCTFKNNSFDSEELLNRTKFKKKENNKYFMIEE
jgi:hypothetical protein